MGVTSVASVGISCLFRNAGLSIRWLSSIITVSDDAMQDGGNVTDFCFRVAGGDSRDSKNRRMVQNGLSSIMRELQPLLQQGHNSLFHFFKRVNEFGLTWR